MKDKTFLMIPGPTPVPESVMLDIAKHPIGHRSSEFSSILKEVYANLKYVFQTGIKFCLLLSETSVTAGLKLQNPAELLLKKLKYRQEKLLTQKL